MRHKFVPYSTVYRNRLSIGDARSRLSTFGLKGDDTKVHSFIPMSIKTIVGENIRRARRQLGWTQEKLGIRASLHSHYISRLELGQENVTVETLEKIAKVLKVTVASFFESEKSS